MRRVSKLLFVSSCSVVVSAASAAAQTCESVAAIALPHATVTAAQSITSGSFTPPGSTMALTGLPPFCRVAVTSTPTSDSIIKLEVWIPLGAGWNGKYQQLGCGGFCGSIGYGGLATAVQRGYASAATDDGSQALGSGSFALGHPEKIVDFGYRALKETTDKAKAVIAAFTGQPPHHSYFAGCSDGGREALMEAQRYPEDFDGIIVGAPANAWTHLFAGFIWNEQALLKDPASYIPSSLLPVLSNAALAQCSKQDPNVAGDLFLMDPSRCNFDPASVQCNAGQDPSTCLTAAQVATARKIYAGPMDPVTGASIFPGYEPGTESDATNWPLWITGAAPGAGFQQFFGNGFYANFVFQNPSWDFRTFNFTTDLALADNGVGQVVNSINPDLRPFSDRGGKMIQYHGWGDSAIAPMSSIDYYNEVSEVVRSKPGKGNLKDIQDFYRLFMVPGMAHCAGGAGPNVFGQIFAAPPPSNDAEHDILTALEHWVEHGVAPERIIATHYTNNTPANGVQLQRPLCPFPQVARLIGHGDPSDANSFRCVKDPGE